LVRCVDLIDRRIRRLEVESTLSPKLAEPAAGTTGPTVTV
jgi:hypothetical protein